MKKIRTIIVDDDPECISYLKNILIEHDYLRIISTYTDSKEAQEAILEIKPELAFLDIEMPGINGLDLAGEIRKKNSATSIIFITIIRLKSEVGYFCSISPINRASLFQFSE